MPRKKREPKISQKQKAVQAVKQTVKVVVGETKKAKRPYRRRAKPSQPAPVQQPIITPFPQVIQLPPQQSPFAMFNPEQFSRAIGDQINQRLAEQPVLAEAMVIPQEGRIVMTEPEQQAPSIAMSMMSPVAKMEIEQTDESLKRELARVRREQEDELAKARTRSPPPRKVSSPMEVPPPPLIQPPPPPRKRSSYVSRADLAEMYLGLTGEPAPTNLKRDELKEIVDQMRRSAGTKMQP